LKTPSNYVVAYQNGVLTVAGLAVSATSTGITTGSNGTATATVTGGTGPYTYSWNTSPVRTTQTITGLTAGTYTVSVKDATNCVVTASVLVSSINGCSLVVNAGPDITLCLGNPVSLNVTVTGALTTNTPFKELATSTANARIYNGKIKEEVIGNTFSKGENSSNCGQNSTSQAKLSSPSGAIVKKAFLYWSGSGALDNTVTLNGVTITALMPADTITFTRKVGTNTLKYFAARADVTTRISMGGTYTVGGLTWNNTSTYCNDNSAYGGWSLVVIYEQSFLLHRQDHTHRRSPASVEFLPVAI